MQTWEQRIRLSNLRLADRFLNFELNVLLHLCFDSGEEGILCPQQIRPVEPVGSEQKIVRQGEQGTVLVDVIQLVDSPERIVPAFVWFEPIDCIDSFLKHSLCFSSLVGFVDLESLCNREFDSPEFLLSKRNNRSTLHSDKNELSCEVVKSRTNVVNHVSCHSDHLERQGGHLLEIVRMEQNYGMGR